MSDLRSRIINDHDVRKMIDTAIVLLPSRKNGITSGTSRNRNSAAKNTAVISAAQRNVNRGIDAGEPPAGKASRCSGSSENQESFVDIITLRSGTGASVNPGGLALRRAGILASVSSSSRICATGKAT